VLRIGALHDLPAVSSLEISCSSLLSAPRIGGGHVGGK